MTNISNPILRGFNPDPSILRVGEDFYIATSTFEWYPGVQIHHSRDLVNWRLVARPLERAGQLDMRGDPDGCGVWAPDLSHADGRFWLVFTDVKRYGATTVHGAKGMSLRDFPNHVVTCETIDGIWSDAAHINSSGFDPALFHDDDGRSWMLNMLWDHRPGRGRFAGIQAQQLDRATLKLVGEPTLIFKGTERGFTEGPHIYKRGGFYHLLVAEGGTGWDHAVVMARSPDLLGPYEVHPDGAVLTSAGRRDVPIARAGHGDLVELADGSTWLAYLCGRPLPGRERCIMGRETAIQPMLWGEDGWLRTVAGDARPDPSPPAPNLPPAPWNAPPWDGRFDDPHLPQDLQWLRSPAPERLFSLTERPGFLRLYGRETVGSLFEQALVARRQTAFRFTATTSLSFAPRSFQQAAGLIHYYNSTKFYYLCVSAEDGRRQLQLVSASPENPAGNSLDIMVDALPPGPIDLRADVDGDRLTFAWRADGEADWHRLPDVHDASILSDEVTLPGLPNFTGAFIGMACQDLSGGGTPADFASFVYREEEFDAPPD
ncbi:xylan 1,4-beta-xylosidase [Sphingobium sp. TA15]|uniref:Xylan 1,4-beta-xylosidase n=1 Tax=Sphingobium indicum (strain DSM 16413 / CCM 7287 / MTCC 6362 / UT26 / NBRC 101211 / UT26S) TaxID=452662 RepID=D4Z7Y2_SPHIU|nr:glycoside hydrolase family 43 protein [Sphingobium indicum]BAI98601.1 xylan 1,4-beta-xylosidase [Sphingobium indicum UT26S]BDD68654.1 xylan 1,4-beta-xylosidase [Sphingobium sp. TA15]